MGWLSTYGAGTPRLDFLAEEVTETEDGLLMGEDGGKGLAKSDMSWSEVSIFSSWFFFPPRRELCREDATEDGVPGPVGALRADRRDGVSGALDPGEDILK